VIDFLDLQAYRDSFVVNLPYGVRKVVEMGRALCTEPSLLLLDEPSSGLSVEETADMAFWIQDIRGLLGITVLMVEHDMSLVSAVSDRVLALNYGRPLAQGTAREVRTIPTSSRPTSGLTDGRPLLRSAISETYYGPIAAIRGVSFAVPKGHRHHPRRQRGGQDHDPQDRVGRHGPEGRGAVRRPARSTGMDPDRWCASG
jgi:energy-coupling factor transporter ATP-binding protein EcfA2